MRASVKILEEIRAREALAAEQRKQVEDAMRNAVEGQKNAPPPAPAPLESVPPDLRLVDFALGANEQRAFRPDLARRGK